MYVVLTASLRERPASASLSVARRAVFLQLADRYRHIHSSKPVMIPVDRPVMPHEGRSAYLHAFFVCIRRIRPASSRSSGRQLRSTESVSLLVPSACRTTIGDRAFPVAAARAWNSLTQRVRAASSIVSLWRELKT